MCPAVRCRRRGKVKVVLSPRGRDGGGMAVCGGGNAGFLPARPEQE